MEYQKTAEATGDFISNKIAKVLKKFKNKIIQKQLQMRMINKYLKKKKIYIYIYQEERQKIIDHLTFNITI